MPIDHGPVTRNVLETAFQAFHGRHEALYGYKLPEAIIEIISLSTTAVGRKDKPPMEFLRPEKISASEQVQPVYFPAIGYTDTKIIQRQSLSTGERVSGPAVLVENGSTTLLYPGDEMT